MGRTETPDDDSVPAMWHRDDEATFENEALEFTFLAALWVEPAVAVGTDPAWFMHPLHAQMAAGMAKLVASGAQTIEANSLFAAVGRKAKDKLEGLSVEGRPVATLGELARLMQNKSGFVRGQAQRLKGDVRANWMMRQLSQVGAYSNGGSPSDNLAVKLERIDALRKAPGGTDFKLRPFSEWKAAGAPPDYLVKGMLQRGYCYGLTGQTGHGKTAVALRLALAIAAGGRFGRHQCKPGRVVYLAGENPDDLRFRCQAVASVEPVAEDNLFIVEGTYDIGQAMTAAQHAVGQIGGADLVVVDTSPAFFFGEAAAGDNPENNNAKMGEHAKALRGLTRLPGRPTVIALCHPVKDAAEDNLNPRGASSFKNELDGNLTLWKHDETMVRLGQNKIRGVEFAPIEFELELLKVAACCDADGEVMPQVSAVFADDAMQSQRERDQEQRENIVVLGFGDGLDSPGICRQELWIGPDGTPENWRVTRIAKHLASADGGKLMVKVRRSWALSKAGELAYGKLKEEREARAAHDGRYEAAEPDKAFVVTGPAPDEPCAQCGRKDGMVFLIRDKFSAVSATPLHERCAPAWLKR